MTEGTYGPELAQRARAPWTDRLAPRNADTAGPNSTSTAKEEGTLAIVVWLLVIGILFEKLSVTIIKGTALELVLPFEFAMIALLVARKTIAVRAIPLVGVLAFFILCRATALSNSSKITSIIYVYLNYLPLIFCVNLSRANYQRFLRIHQTLMMAAALLVFVDWAFQFSGKSMPNMEHFLPSGLRFFNFNYIQPLQWGSKYTKPNAFFFLETSYIAQYMAVSFVIEFCLFRRTLYLGAYLAALLITFGGTGYTLLILSVPLMFFYCRTKTVGLAIALAPLALLLAASFGVFDNLVHRTNEFNQSGSSGDQRFAGQLRELEGRVTDPDIMVFGIGPGNMEQGTGIVWIPPVKVMIEYGLFTAIAFLGLIFYCACTRGTPPPVAYTTLLQFLFLNGGFLVPVNVFYLIIMSCFVKVKREPN